MVFPDDVDFTNTNNTPSVKKVVADIEPNDEVLQIVGYARQLNASEEFKLDDGTGMIEVREIPEDFPSIQENALYRVMGRLTLDAVGTQYIAADILQDLHGLDLDLYQNALKLKKQNP